MEWIKQAKGMVFIFIMLFSISLVHADDLIWNSEDPVGEAFPFSGIEENSLAGGGTIFMKLFTDDMQSHTPTGDIKLTFMCGDSGTDPNIFGTICEKDETTVSQFECLAGTRVNITHINGSHPAPCNITSDFVEVIANMNIDINKNYTYQRFMFSGDTLYLRAEKVAGMSALNVDGDDYSQINPNGDYIGDRNKWLDIVNITTYTASPVEEQAPVITIVYPSNDSIINTDVDINITTDINASCTTNTTAFNNIITGGLVHEWSESTLLDGNYQINVSCSDSSVIINFTKALPFVNFLSPANNSIIDGNNTIPFIFEFGNFAPNICYLLEREFDFWEIVGNISAVLFNQTTETNISTRVLNTTGLLNYYDFEEGSGSFVTDKASGNTGNNSGALYTSSKGGNETGNYSLAFTSDEIHIANKPYYDFGTDTDFSMSAWFRTTHGGDSQYHMILDQRQGGNNGWFLAITTSDTLQATANAISMETVDTYTDTEWHHVVASWDRDNAGNSDIYVDNVSMGVGALSSGTDINSPSELHIGSRQFSVGIYWEGDLDEIMVFNRSLTPEDVSKLYLDGLYSINFTTEINTTEVQANFTPFTNLSILHTETSIGDADLYRISCVNNQTVNSSDHLIFYDFDEDDPILTLLSPTIDQQTFNKDLWINFTLDENGSCIVNNTAFSLFSGNGSVYNYFENSLDNGDYVINVTCNDDALIHSINNSVSILINMTKDLLFPLIDQIAPTNNSIITTDLLILKTNVTENNELFSLAVNITNNVPFIGETVLFSDFINVSGTNYVYTQILNSSLFPSNEELSYNVRVCDAHTDSKLKRLNKDNIEKGKDNLKFKIGKSVIHIKALDQEVHQSGYIEKVDRFAFNFKYESFIPIKTYKLTSNRELEYLEFSDFSGHFILRENDIWLDFVTDGEVTVEKVVDEQDSYYLIYVENSETDVYFNSIGELNCNEASYLFTIDREEDTTNIFNFDLSTTTNVILIFVLVFLYVGLWVLSYMFKNFGFASFGFFVGLFLGFLLFNLHWIMTALFFLLNTTIFVLFIKESN